MMDAASCEILDPPTPRDIARALRRLVQCRDCSAWTKPAKADGAGRCRHGTLPTAANGHLRGAFLISCPHYEGIKP